MAKKNSENKPLVIVTGADGLIGRRLCDALQADYAVAKLDVVGDDDIIECDLTDPDSTAEALETAVAAHDGHIASVVHLAAYYAFSSEPHPLYESLNVQGTVTLLEEAAKYSAEQFLYASSMLVHSPTQPGVPITESHPLGPTWPYPASKLAAEQAIAEHRGGVATSILRFAGLYTDWGESPTLAHQIQRIFERQMTGHLYAGDTHSGQSAIYIDDCIEAMRLAIEKRKELPEDYVALIGERQAVPYQHLQNAIGEYLHGGAHTTLSVPKPAAKLGAWLQSKAEPVIPDAIDHGETPFIQPFMIDLAEDHFELDTSHAQETLGFECEHSLPQKLSEILDNLMTDPQSWYERNKLQMPAWLQDILREETPAEELLDEHQVLMQQEHDEHLWAHLLNIGLGAWLLTGPVIAGYVQTPAGVNEALAGVAVMVFAALSTLRNLSWARWITGLIGLWIAFAPLVFWTQSAAAYLQGTLIGGLIAGLALVPKPVPGISPAARLDPSTIPEGWEYSPSSWEQRIPIIALAFVGLFISRYLAAYQLEQIPAAWDPFFADGTQRIITSDVSKAWPVPDAGLGGFVYLMEIITGLMGSQKRWRTMPWLVLLFGTLIVPLGAVSLYFIIIQPIVIGTWCTLCLVAAAAMLLQIPYSFDEIVATIQVLRQRVRAGDTWYLVLFRGVPSSIEDRELRTSDALLRKGWFVRMWQTGLSSSWNLWACVGIGVLLMFSRLLFESTVPLAYADHLIGALVIAISIAALAEVARPLRFINMLLGTALIGVPFLFDGGGMAAALFDVLAGLALIVLSVPRGPINDRYGSWDKYLF